jgi:recombination protein RecA
LKSGYGTEEEHAMDGSTKTTDEKRKALEATRLAIEKQFGKGSLMRMGDQERKAEMEVIPTGSILLDAALGVGGYPRGRIIEIYGPESSGKTTLALHAIAEAQKLGGISAFVDAEHALDPTYAKNLGVKIDDLWVSQPDTGEQALEIVESLVRSGAVDLIVVDSVAALTPRAEIEGEMGDAHVGLQARLMSQALRKLTATISKSGSCLIFINQIRMKIGVMFGNPETTTGGNALKFYSTIRLEVRRVETISQGSDDAVGNKVRVKVVKNKVSPPYRKAELEMMFGSGISAAGSLLDAALQHKIVEKSGSWYSYGTERIGQGRDNARQFIEQHADVLEHIDRKVREILFPKQVSPAGNQEAGTPDAASRPAEAPKPAAAETEAAPPARRAPAQVAESQTAPRSSSRTVRSESADEARAQKEKAGASRKAHVDTDDGGLF